MPSDDSWELPRRLFLKEAGFCGVFCAYGVGAKRSNGVSVTETDSIVQLKNDELILTIQRETGGIHQLKDQQTGAKLRDTTTQEPTGMWGIEFYHSDYETLLANSFRASSPAIETKESNRNAEVKIRWQDVPVVAPPHGPLDEPFNASITVEISLEAGAKTLEFNMGVENDSAYAIKTLTCPQVTSIQSQHPNGEDALVVPQRMGRRYQNPTKTQSIPRYLYPSGFGTMQFTAYTSPLGGFYTDARDAEGNTKISNWTTYPDRPLLGFNSQYLHPYRPGSNAKIPYTTTFGVLRGDWQDAAERYKTWITQKGPLASVTPDNPDWLLEKGVSYRLLSYTRFDRPQQAVEFEQATEWVLDVRERLETSVMLHWWGWPSGGFPSPGDWMPPEDGLDAFRETIQRLREEGIETDVFLNITNLTEDADILETDRERALNWILKNRDGSLRSHTGNHGYRFYQVEPTHEGWQDHVRNALDKIINAGAQELHLDGFPWSGPPMCYDDDHDHPTGQGGNWYSTKAATALQEIQSRYKDERPRLAIGGEGISEYYLDEMDVHNIRDVQAEVYDPVVDRGKAEVIPLLNYTLGDYYISRGELNTPPSTVHDQRELLRLWIGRSLIWGMLLEFQFPEPIDGPNSDDRMLDYIGRVGRARESYANRFVARGDLLREPKFEINVVHLEGRGGKWTTTTDTVLGSAWRSSREEVGFVFTNVSNQGTPESFTLTLDAQPYQYPGSPLVYTVVDGTYHRREAESGEIRMELEPEEVQLLVFAPRTGQREKALDELIKSQRAVENAPGMNGRESLTAAKRAFEADNLGQSIEYAKKAKSRINTESTSTQGTSNSTPTSAANKDSTESNTIVSAGTKETGTKSTGVSIPGFDLFETTAGLAGTALLLRWLDDE